MAVPHTGVSMRKAVMSYYGKPQVTKPVAALHLICYFRCAGIMQKVEETFIKEYA